MNDKKRVKTISAEWAEGVAIKSRLRPAVFTYAYAGGKDNGKAGTRAGKDSAHHSVLRVKVKAHQSEETKPSSRADVSAMSIATKVK